MLRIKRAVLSDRLSSRWRFVRASLPRSAPQIMTSRLANPQANSRRGNQCAAKDLSPRGRFRNQAHFPLVGGIGELNSVPAAKIDMVLTGEKFGQCRRHPGHVPRAQASAAVIPEEELVGPFLVREAEEKDLQQAAAVLVEAFNTFRASVGQGVAFDEQHARDVFCWVRDVYFDPQKRLVVAVSLERGGEGRVIGMTGLSLQDPVAFVKFVGVETASSRKGVGRELISNVIRICERESNSATLSLIMEAANPAAFALYASLGFNVIDACTCNEGYVSDSVANAAIRAVEKEGTFFRQMEETDVPKCNELYVNAVGHSRLNNIMAVQRMPYPQPSLVAVRLTDTGEEKVVAYCTTYTLLGHSVAIDEQHFIALVSFASKLSKTEGRGGILVQCRPRANPDIVRWVLKSGLRVKMQTCWMTRGEPISVNPALVYGVGLDY